MYYHDLIQVAHETKKLSALIIDESQADKEALTDKVHSFFNSITAIDNFVRATQHKPETDANINPIELAKKSLELNDEVVSETLARIYESQNKLQKAAEMYEKLSLKFPEKSSYFAALIQNLKNKS